MTRFPIRPLIAACAVVVAALAAGPQSGAAAPPGLRAGSASLLLGGGSVPLSVGGATLGLRAVPNPLAEGVTSTYRGVLVPDAGYEVRLNVTDRVEGIVVQRSTGTGWILASRRDGGADAVPFADLSRTPVGGREGLGRLGSARPSELGSARPSELGSARPSELGSARPSELGSARPSELGSARPSELGSARPSGAVHPARLSEPEDPPEPENDGTLLLRVAVEADHEVWQTRPDDWQELAGGLFNLVEAVYAQLDVRFAIVGMEAWDVPDPYTATHACGGAPGTEGDGKLEQLRSFWLSDPARQAIARDTVHLMARTLTGGFIGCAYINELNTDRAFGVNRLTLSSVYPDAGFLYDNVNLISHELGHNFGGLHERSIGAYGLTGSAAGVQPYTIMNPVAEKGVLRFSDLEGVQSPTTDRELNNAGHMRSYAEGRLGAAPDA